MCASGALAIVVGKLASRGKRDNGCSCGSRLTGRDTSVGPKLGQIGPKWDKSGIFQIRFQFILVLNVI